MGHHTRDYSESDTGSDNNINYGNTYVHLHETWAMMAPPINGPIPLPQATAAPMKPLYLPRCCRVVMSLAIIITNAVLRHESILILQTTPISFHSHRAATKTANGPKGKQDPRVGRKPGHQVSNREHQQTRNKHLLAAKDITKPPVP